MCVGDSFDTVAVKALVDVVWSRPAQDQALPHSCGLRFAAMDDEGARRLKAFISQAGVEES